MKRLMVLLFPIIAHATCNFDESIDYRKMYPKVFGQIPITEQDIGICYAHAGATIIDFHRMKNNDKGNVSPLELASLSKRKKSSAITPIEGGNICEVVNAASQRGYGCDASLTIQTRKFGLAIQAEVVKNVFLDFLTKKKVYVEISRRQYTTHQNLSEVQKEVLHNMAKAYSGIVKIFQDYGFSSEIASEEEIFFISQKIYLSNKHGTYVAEFSKFLFSKICQSKSRLKIPPLKCIDKLGKGSSLMVAIDEAIDSRRPIGIGYCSRVLKEKNFTATPEALLNENTCLPHASVIIGREYKEESDKCFYLIRNSWGKKSQYAWPTSNGDIWIEEGALKKNLFMVNQVY